MADTWPLPGPQTREPLLEHVGGTTASPRFLSVGFLAASSTLDAQKAPCRFRFAGGTSELLRHAVELLNASDVAVHHAARVSRLGESKIQDSEILPDHLTQSSLLLF